MIRVRLQIADEQNLRLRAVQLAHLQLGGQPKLKLNVGRLDVLLIVDRLPEELLGDDLVADVVEGAGKAGLGEVGQEGDLALAGPEGDDRQAKVPADRLGGGERGVGLLIFAVGQKDELTGARRVINVGEDFAHRLERLAHGGAAAAGLAELLNGGPDGVHVVGAEGLGEKVRLVVEGDQREEVVAVQALHHLLHDADRHLAAARHVGLDALGRLPLGRASADLARVRIAADEDIHRFGDIDEQDQVRRNACRRHAGKRGLVRLDRQERVDVARRILLQERPVQLPA